jgi:DNA-binding CsgD family transcriptional regulator
VSSHRAVEDGTPPLTPREREVLELLAVGLSNREIGQALQISAHTAKFHVQGVLEKLDATSRTEAAVRAARRLWI